MTPEQEKNIEAKLVELCSKFEKFAQGFSIALENTDTKKQAQWYTLRGMTLRLLKVTASASGPELQTACVALHGAIDLLGFKGTLQLILNLRRNYIARTKAKTKVERKDSAVPGVRHGNSTDQK